MYSNVLGLFSVITITDFLVNFMNKQTNYSKYDVMTCTSVTWIYAQAFTDHVVRTDLQLKDGFISRLAFKQCHNYMSAMIKCYGLSRRCSIWIVGPTLHFSIGFHENLPSSIPVRPLNWKWKVCSFFCMTFLRWYDQRQEKCSYSLHPAANIPTSAQLSHTLLSSVTDTWSRNLYAQHCGSKTLLRCMKSLISKNNPHFSKFSARKGKAISSKTE